MRSATRTGIVEDTLAAGPGSYSATAVTSAGRWVMQVAAFKAAARTGSSSSPTPTPTPTSHAPSTPPAPTTHAPSTTAAPPTKPSTPAPAPQTSSSATSAAAPPVTSGSRPGCAAPNFPNANCTGVPAGTQLSTYTGPCTITAANTVIDSKIVNCSQLTVKAANVTIKNSKVNTNVWLDQDQPGSDSWSMTIVDSEVDAGPHQIPAICCGHYTVQRVNSHGGQNGGQCENGNKWCTITDSWLHGQYMLPGSNWHLGGFLSDGSDNLTLIHNYIVCDHPVDNGEGCTGDINLIPNFSAISGALIENNLLGANTGSAFCTFGGRSRHRRHLTRTMLCTATMSSSGAPTASAQTTGR